MPPSKYFLFARSENGLYWPLDLQPATLTSTRQLLRHMLRSNTRGDAYVIAVWDAAREEFRHYRNGAELPIHNPIYTATAWQDFLAARPRLAKGSDTHA